MGHIAERGLDNFLCIFQLWEDCHKSKRRPSPLTLKGLASTSVAAVPAQTPVKKYLKQEGFLTYQASCIILLDLWVTWGKQLSFVHFLPGLACNKQLINVFWVTVFRTVPNTQQTLQKVIMRILPFVVFSDQLSKTERNRQESYPNLSH